MYEPCRGFECKYFSFEKFGRNSELMYYHCNKLEGNKGTWYSSVLRCESCEKINDCKACEHGKVCEYSKV